MTRRLGFALIVLLVALLLIVGYGGALQPLVYAGVAGVLAMVVVIMLAYHWPVQALACTPFLVIVAGTRFRVRDPLAAVAGDIDAAVLAELALYAVVALIVLLAFLSAEFRPSRLGLLERLLVAFAGVALGSTLWSIAPKLTFVRAGQFAILVALALVVVRTMEPEHYLRCIGTSLLVFVLAAAGMAAVFPFARLQQFDPLMEGGRFAWFGMHPIETGAHTALAFLFVLAELLYSPRPLRIRRFGVPLWLFMAPLAVILIATNSRGPLFAFVAAAGALVAMRMLRLWAALLLSAVLLVGVITYSNVGASITGALRNASESQNPAAMLLMRGQSAQDFEHMTGRTGLWSNLLPIVGEEPLLGHGYQASRPLVLRVALWAGNAHNALLQMLLDVGIIGAVLFWLPFIAMLILAVRHSAELRSLALWPLGALLGFGLFELVDSLSNAAFAGSPGLALALVVTGVIIADRVWLQHPLPAVYPRARWVGASASLDRPPWWHDHQFPTIGE